MKFTKKIQTTNRVRGTGWVGRSAAALLVRRASNRFLDDFHNLIEALSQLNSRFSQSPKSRQGRGLGNPQETSFDGQSNATAALLSAQTDDTKCSGCLFSIVESHKNEPYSSFRKMVYILYFHFLMRNVCIEYSVTHSNGTTFARKLVICFSHTSCVVLEPEAQTCFLQKAYTIISIMNK